MKSSSGRDTIIQTPCVSYNALFVFSFHRRPAGIAVAAIFAGMARHPLQRLPAPSRQFSMLFHIAGIASFAGSFNFLRTWDTPMADSFGGHYQFLTIIGLAAATITFTIGLAADLTLSQSLFRAKNFLAIVSGPLEALITILYWGICAIDNNLILPGDLGLDIVPDIGFHAAPGILLILDLLLFSPPWTIQAYQTMALSMVFAFSYWYWVELCFSHNGWYPYPLFDLLDTWQRILLFTFSALLMTGSTMALKWLYGKFNGIEQFKKEAANLAGSRPKAE